MRWIIIAAVTLVVALCLVGAVLFFVARQEHSQEPDLGPLAGSLRQRMDDLFGSESLSDSTVEISVVKSQVDAEINRVKYLAAKLGGSAVMKQPIQGSTTDLIAEIPEASRKLFINAVLDGFKDLPETEPLASAKTCVVTVQIKVQG